MYIRSVHEDNDSSATPTGRRGELPDDEIKRMLWRGFGLRMDELRDLNVT